MQKQATQSNTYRITYMYTKVYFKEPNSLRNVWRVQKGRKKGVTKITGITEAGSKSFGKFHRGESSEEYLWRGGTHNKSHDNNKDGIFRAKEQKFRDPVGYPLHRSQQHTDSKASLTTGCANRCVASEGWQVHLSSLLAVGWPLVRVSVSSFIHCALEGCAGTGQDLEKSHRKD